MNEENTTNFTDKDAIYLTNQNAITFENIINNIKNKSKNGSNNILLFDIMFPYDVMKKVLDAGFSISTRTGMMGENVIKISW